jgi:hypothetical protein
LWIHGKYKISICLKEEDYDDKVYRCISEKNCIQVSSNLTHRFQKNIRRNLNEDNHVISSSQKWKLINLNPTTPTFSRLMQIHKDNPLRPVINWTNAPAHTLAKHLDHVLNTIYTSYKCLQCGKHHKTFI